jgi:hypothetical protein
MLARTHLGCVADPAFGDGTLHDGSMARGRRELGPVGGVLFSEDLSGTLRDGLGRPTRTASRPFREAGR